MPLVLIVRGEAFATDHFIRGNCRAEGITSSVRGSWRILEIAYPMDVAITLFILRWVFFSNSLKTGNSWRYV
jgi:hypothetical protein